YLCVFQERAYMEINIPNDCGNAPRKIFLKDFHVAHAEGDILFLEKHVTEAISWEIIGSKSIETKARYLAEAPHYPQWNVQKLTIDAIITHGNDAAVHGKITTADGNEFAFSDLYKFKGFKGFNLQSIKTFLIKLSK